MATFYSNFLSFFIPPPNRSTARLVDSEGCRNPSYRVLAPRNPWRDPSNRLIVNFDFRVFMFQEMESGDAIMITANVVACVDEIDCAPVSWSIAQKKMCERFWASFAFVVHLYLLNNLRKNCFAGFFSLQKSFFRLTLKLLLLFFSNF